MEAVGIVVSIFTFVQVADRVINLCKSYPELARDAPSDLRAILIKTSTLQTVLHNLQFLASCGHSPTALHILAGEEGPIAGCIRVHKLTAYRGGTQTWRSRVMVNHNKLYRPLSILHHVE
jgi:hypothetical protein